MYEALLSRAMLMAKLGQQYGTDRDVYEALGYPLTLSYEDYAARYERQDMAKAIIDRPVEATWRGKLQLQESPVGGDTEFERIWGQLVDRLGLKGRFIRADKISQIGRWGILLLGFDGTRNTTDFASPVPAGATKKLVYVKPFGEGNAKIDSYDENTSSERFGMPEIYDVTITNNSTKVSSNIKVHHSRVLHITPQLLESEYEGVPTLQSVFNRLMDLEKLTGGSAEMFWRGARPGYQAVIDPEYTLTDTVRDTLQDQYNEYEHKLRRIMMLEGVELKALESQVETPKDHVDVIIQMISAATGIPKRILTGSERGELASTEDKGSWLELIDYRRSEYAGPVIIDKFVRKCQDHNILPKPKDGYTIMWEDLWSPSDIQQAKVGRERAEAIRAYGQSPGAPALLPEDLFLELCLGLDEDEIARVRARKEELMTAEEPEVTGEAV